MKRFVLKVVDRKENDWSYFSKGSKTGDGKMGVFYDNYVFNTEAEARQHIKTLLTCGYLREEIVEDDFYIVEVRQHKGFGNGWYTDEEIEMAIKDCQR